MNIIDILLLGGVLAAFCFALRKWIRDRKNGSCCSGDCSACGGGCSKSK